MRITTTLLRFAGTVGLIGLSACEQITGTRPPYVENPVPPKRPEYTCTNALRPAGAFRTIYSKDAIHPDTTPVTMNRFRTPHRSADTVTTVTNQGYPMLIIFGDMSPTSTDCQSLADSLRHHLPNAREELWLS